MPHPDPYRLNEMPTIQSQIPTKYQGDNRSQLARHHQKNGQQQSGTVPQKAPRKRLETKAVPHVPAQVEKQGYHQVGIVVVAAGPLLYHLLNLGPESGNKADRYRQEVHKRRYFGFVVSCHVLLILD